jgi:hypothetical protein
MKSVPRFSLTRNTNNAAPKPTKSKLTELTLHPQVAVAGIRLGMTMDQDVSIRYQWRHNGVNIPNERDATLNTQNAQVSDAGNYSVPIKNCCRLY